MEKEPRPETEGMENETPESPATPADREPVAEAAEPVEVLETAETAESAPGPEALGQMLKEAQARAEENRNLALRAQADVENLRRRHEKELENARKYALDRFVEALLPVLDSMELGLNAAGDDGADLARLREGHELTLKLFADVMGKFNVEVVDPEGEPFNPERHQAMAIQPRDDLPPNTVVTVVQKGYLLNGRLVRPAMVMVSQKPAQ